MVTQKACNRGTTQTLASGRLTLCSFNHTSKLAEQGNKTPDRTHNPRTDLSAVMAKPSF